MILIIVGLAIQANSAAFHKNLIVKKIIGLLTAG